jgi:hypothetical protein
MIKNYRNIISTFIGLIILISLGCTTTKEVSTPDATTADTAAAVDDVSELQAMLNSNRSKLSDLHISQTHDMPEAFLKKSTSNKSLNINPYDGYRIQIISTRELQLADSVANEFRMWADTTISGYSAETYQTFRQPFFKVHVGDFQQRDRANSFAKLVKRKYPDAWVVHDRIEPENTPADTASFSLITPAERKKMEMKKKMMKEEN